MDTPPPPPPPYHRTGSSFFHHAATGSLWATPLAILMTTMSTVALSSVSEPKVKGLLGVLIGLFSGVIIISGFIAGIIALCGIPRFGKKGLLWKAVCGVILPLILIALAIPSLISGIKRGQERLQAMGSIENQLEASVVAINRLAPKNIDSDTRMDGAETRPGRTLVYKYTLVNLSKSDIEPATFENLMRPELIKSYKTIPDLQTMRDNGVTLVYRYADKDGQLIAEIPISPKDF